MMPLWIGIAVGLVLTVALWRYPIWIGALFWAIFCTTAAIMSAIGQDWPYVGINSAIAAFQWWAFWRNRPRGQGKKTAKLIGAKARAIRARIVAAMPHPSTRPLPA